MAQKKGYYPIGDYPFAPSAPPPSQHNGMPTYIPDRPPPPTYEESQKSQNYNPPVAPALTKPQNHFPVSSGPNIGYPQLNQGYGHYPIVQPQFSPSTTIRNTQQNNAVNQQPVSKSVHVLQYAAGTRFNGKGAGSISVPPPPPGVAPTPAQIAALQGQPVILQKKKHSFF